MKAIETRYKGYRFRSRLEARWAVFFDALIKTEWQYEIEGFELGGGERYLPDFYLPVWRLWVEVKPTPVPQASKAREHPYLLKAAKLAKGKGEMVFVTGGDPDQMGLLFHPPQDGARGQIMQTHIKHCLGTLNWAVFDDAMAACRGARFEHGEHGAAR